MFATTSQVIYCFPELSWLFSVIIEPQTVTYSHLFAIEKRAQKMFFHLSPFSLPRSDAPSAHLVYSCLGRR